MSTSNICDRNAFDLRVAQWIVRHPEYGALIVGTPEIGEDGEWEVLAHDGKCWFLLRDDGAGNITISYDGAM